MEDILQLLPKKLTDSLRNQFSPPEIQKVEEIRLRIHKPVELVFQNRTMRLTQAGQGYMFSEKEAEQVMGKLSSHSLYSLEEELKRGYITIKGGHRVGICGQTVTASGIVQHIHHISSFNIRIARQHVQCAEHVINYLIEDGRCVNTLIIGKPQSGKTTLLRELARQFSDGDPTSGRPAFKVGIVDERSEIAGCYHGIPQNDIGKRTDVLDACPKAEGMMMMIRSMSPEILIVDELGRKEDMEAIFEAINAGVHIIATIHGSFLEQIIKRPWIQPLLKAHVFDRFVELDRTGSRGESPSAFIHAIRETHGKLLKRFGVE